MAWNEFYMTTTGDNLNSGSTTANAAPLTYAAGTFVRSTGVFTVGSGNPLSDGVLVGDFVSIYTTSGATGATFVAKVSARDATTITVDVTTSKIGVATNVSEGAAATTCKVGGAWASLVIVGTLFVAQTMTMNACVNIKAGTYANTTSGRTFAATATTALPIWWRGYKATPGDLDDGVTIARSLQDGVNLPLITFTTGQIIPSGAHHSFSNLDITSAVTAANGAIHGTGTFLKFIRCRIENTAANANSLAFNIGGNNQHLINCRLKATTTAASVVRCGQSGSLQGCHVIGGIIGVSMPTATGGHINKSVIESFATTGIECSTTSTFYVISNCTIYAAATNGINISAVPTGNGLVSISNVIIGGCTNGITAASGTNAVGIHRVHFYNCTNNLVNITELATVGADLGILGGLIDDDTDPFVAKAGNDFTLAAAAIDKSAGWPGVFEGQTAMVGYPDIGAVRHIDPTAGGGGRPEFRGSNL